jgi:hypothetical protein
MHRERQLRRPQHPARVGQPEYAAKIAGAKAIVVLGDNSWGAIKAQSIMLSSGTLQPCRGISGQCSRPWSWADGPRDSHNATRRSSPRGPPRITDRDPHLVGVRVIILNAPPSDRENDAALTCRGGRLLPRQQMNGRGNENRGCAGNKISAIDHHAVAPSHSSECDFARRDDRKAAALPHRIAACPRI